MKKLTLTALRQQIFQIADEVLETGVPAVIERNGQVLLLSPKVAATGASNPRRRARWARIFRQRSMA